MNPLPPGLAGFEMARQAQQQQSQNQLGQLSGLMQIQGVLSKQQLGQQFRGALANAKTPEEQALVAAQFGGPEGILKHTDRLAQIAATREASMARLSQAAQQYNSTFLLRWNSAANADQRLALDREKESFKRGIQAEASRLAGAKANYDFGFTPTPQAPPTPPAVPDIMSGRPPAEQAAIQSVIAAGDTPAMADVGNYQPPQASPASPAAPAQAPVAPPIPAAAIVAPAAPSPVPAAPVMPPAIVNAPKKIQDQWLLAQSKPGASGTASDTVVDAIISGRMQMPTGFALRSPYWQDVIERVSAKDPKFDATRYAARAAARRTFSSGPEARNVTALNTVIGHLGTLDEAATALDNGDVRVFNAVANRLATELGDPRVQNFDTAKQAVAEETMRVFRQVGASESEARQWGERINSSGSPKQLRGVISTLGNLLDSRVQAIAQQYERTVNEVQNPARLDPSNLRTLDRLRQGGQPSDLEQRLNKYK